MATEIKANIVSPPTVKANVEVGGTVKVNVTAAVSRTTSAVQNIIRASIKDAGPKGEKGDTGATGDTGAQGIQGPGSNIRVYTWVLDFPIPGVVPGPKLKEPHTITSIESHTTDETSVAFNIEERTNFAASGVDVLTSDQVATPAGDSDTTFANPSIATDSWLYLDISAVVGTPQKVVITVAALV
jgi:hypothetical protein